MTRGGSLRQLVRRVGQATKGAAGLLLGCMGSRPWFGAGLWRLRGWPGGLRPANPATLPILDLTASTDRGTLGLACGILCLTCSNLSDVRIFWRWTIPGTVNLVPLVANVRGQLVGRN